MSDGRNVLKLPVRSQWDQAGVRTQEPYAAAVPAPPPRPKKGSPSRWRVTDEAGIAEMTAGILWLFLVLAYSRWFHRWQCSTPCSVATQGNTKDTCIGLSIRLR